MESACYTLNVTIMMLKGSGSAPRLIFVMTRTQLGDCNSTSCRTRSLALGLFRAALIGMRSAVRMRLAPRLRARKASFMYACSRCTVI